ncbi:MAG: hypothetical protein E6I10_01150 [Chloroflexi bacterium]|nr:MAG: hypothetical protein E6I10_01150 [Chloroflexota bacterium]
MVDPRETFITGEGVEVCMLVIPHRWLGGVSLVVRSSPPATDLLWAGITDLRDHDQIDLGHVVASWGQGNHLDALKEKLGEELSRRLDWRQTYRGGSPRPRRVTALLEHAGKRVNVDVMSKLSLWPLPQREVIEQTSLDSAEPPTFRLPVPIDKLLTQA